MKEIPLKMVMTALSCGGCMFNGNKCAGTSVYVGCPQCVHGVIVHVQI